MKWALSARWVMSNWVDYSGSTRSSALLRIGLVLLLWSRWADELAFFHKPKLALSIVGVLFFVSTLLLAVGLFTRVAACVVAGVALVLVHGYGLAWGKGGWAHHHTMLLAYSTVLCALLPAGKSYSLDRWIMLRRAKRQGSPPPREHGPLFGLRLIALQVSAVYLFSAYDKLTLTFLSGDRLEAILMWFYLGSDYPNTPLFPVLATCAAIATVILELALGVGLWFGRSRRWLLIPGLALHGIFYVLLPVSTYSLTMWCLYLAFLDPDAFHRGVDALSTPSAAPSDPKPSTLPVVSP